MREYDKAAYRNNRRALAETTLPRCAVCGTTENLECDHAKEVHQGGDSSIGNLQWLCRRHNMKKHHNVRRGRDYYDDFDTGTGEFKDPKHPSNLPVEERLVFL